MPRFICTTCGVQHAETEASPDRCAICEDERQYIGWGGQLWTTLDELQSDHTNRIHTEEPGLTGIGTQPKFGIGQRALMVRSPGGHVLWDCIALIDDATVAAVRDLGGLAAIAISHPHYYSAMVPWSRAFGGIPIYLHADDRRWVMRPDPAIEPWDGETRALHDGMTLVRCGGHFPGGTVLLRPDGADGSGTLLSGDIVQVIPDRGHVGFMYSYPNLIPLPPASVTAIADALEPYEFETIQGAWWGTTVPRDGKAVVRRSAERYVRAVAGDLP